MIQMDTTKVDVLLQKLKEIPQKLQTKITRTILREALKESKAREDLISYINTNFQKRTGIYRKSVSTIKTSRARSDHNRIISYIYFLPVSKVAKGKNSNHIPPKILTHWLNAGTRDHRVGKGSRMAGNKTIQQLSENKYQIAINRAKLNLLKAKTEKQRSKYEGIIARNTKKLAIVQTRRSANKQSGRLVKGITVHHFMENIQRKVDTNAVTIVFESVQKAVRDLLK